MQCTHVKANILTNQKWYFVTKIVLTYCEKKKVLVIEKNFCNSRLKAKNMQEKLEKKSLIFLWMRKYLIALLIFTGKLRVDYGHITHYRYLLIEIMGINYL